MLRVMIFIAASSFMAHGLFYLVIDFKGLLPAILNNLITAVLFLIPYLLYQKGKFDIAQKVALLIMELSFIYLIFFLVGKPPAIHYHLIMVSVMPLTIWSLKKVGYSIIFFAVNIGLFLIVELYSDLLNPALTFPEAYLMPYKICCIVLPFLSLLFIRLSFMREIEDTTNKIVEKNRVIFQKNKKLKAAMKSLEEAQEHLIQSEKMASIGILTAGVAHEINNPLNYIMFAYEGLNECCDTGNFDNVSSHLDTIERGILRSANVVNSLYQFSRNGNSLNEKCNIHKILDNSIIVLNHKFENRIELQKELVSSSCVVSGNIGGLHQVFLNILSNAEQSIIDKGKIIIKTFAEGSSLQIEISDTGCGIASENMKRITDPFFTTKDPGEGIGMGLSIASKIIKDHGGAINFRSQLNKGSEVKVTLPID